VEYICTEVVDYINTMKTTFYSVLIFNKLSSNYKFTSNQREVFLLTTIFMCIHAMLDINQNLNRKSSSCIDIIAYNCMLPRANQTETLREI